jgi:hypothetical protein
MVSYLKTSDNFPSSVDGNLDQECPSFPKGNDPSLTHDPFLGKQALKAKYSISNFMHLSST